MANDPTVFVIDHDEATRSAVRALLRSVDIPIETFPTACEFLEAYDPQRPGCLVLDARLPGMSGLELQQRLANWEVPPPVIIITGYGDIPMAVEAMRNGAVDFIEKPFRPQLLLDRIHEGFERDAAARRAHAQRAALAACAALLTPRESEVMTRVAAGLPNRAIAEELGVTPKAIEAYRARVMRKMQAESLAALVRMNVVLESGWVGDGPRRLESRASQPEARTWQQPATDVLLSSHLQTDLTPTSPAGSSAPSPAPLALAACASHPPA